MVFIAIRYMVHLHLTLVFSLKCMNIWQNSLPLTTCERGQLLSHFYIHFSPIYYLFLPIYMIFRTPITLVVIQSIMVFGAVIPLLLLCKKYGIKPLIALVICFIYIYSPAIVQPLLYDFHENAFIPFFCTLVCIFP